MSGIVFALRDPGPESPTKGLTGSTPLEQAWLDALARIVVGELDRDQVWFMMAILWAPPLDEPRSPDDACSRLQRLGIVRPTTSRSVCVPAMLTPLGHNVRDFLGSVAMEMPR
jgi:hypothetical protein